MADWSKKELNKGELTFKIDLDKIKEGLDKAFDKNKKNIKVPGFRKGKVSRQVFNQMYGEEALYQDALNIMLPEVYAEAVAEAEIDPVGQPNISVESMEKGKPWVLKADVSVKPDVKLGEYKGVEVPKQNTRVYKKDIDAKLDSMLQSQAELVLVDRPAKDGDTVIIDFDGSVDGNHFEGGKANNYSLELGSGSFIPGFEDQLVGHKAGDDVEVKVTFPADYPQKDLAGKEALFETKIHEVKEKQLPKLDDEFAKDVDEDVDTLEALKAKIKTELKEQKEAAAHDTIENDAIDAAVNNATVKDIPQVMLDEDVERQMDQYLAGIQQQGIPADMYFKMTGTSKDDLKKQFVAGADKRVKTSLVLEAIVKAEKINPSEDDVNAEVADLAKQYGMKEEAVRGALSDDMLKHDIGIQKAVSVVVDNAKQVSKNTSSSDEK
ncbi:trigger factor [Lactobacillus sanfranciscensis]|uniref:Trigger factor n=1 Tax=Fructilactobacillus sanfranciscensis (strain TMW 1.1304) TaxID=714313 RepID=G2KWH1_FRUST|nr:trigger factor [Fructilactobacillus sanfranciscensis]AEN99365.1 Trigger factor [Fructilactobacillus sanfranciscensis TMW 1.1304]NDR75419.1 trigger factor [Fructilactobacillus sanfranciscensis]NDR96005.1 trigger factor [Fructilactobacillus sanfranciscensis]NDS03872.1 trigger factor [Fructilactobacillus sanfranciscensis]POH20343.1 trigger factor [Fructilactobacillus sanfranciscensis]